MSRQRDELLEQRSRERPEGPERRDVGAQEEPQDAAGHVTAQVERSSRALESGESEEESLVEVSLPVDARKTAEAIMRKIAPELYQALLNAGEIEE